MGLWAQCFYVSIYKYNLDDAQHTAIAGRFFPCRLAVLLSLSLSLSLSLVHGGEDGEESGAMPMQDGAAAAACRRRRVAAARMHRAGGRRAHAGELPGRIRVRHRLLRLPGSLWLPRPSPTSSFWYMQSP